MYLICRKGVWTNRKSTLKKLYSILEQLQNSTDVSELMFDNNDTKNQNKKPTCGLHAHRRDHMKEELKELIEKMNEEQFRWFISQMRLVLSEEAA